MFFFVTTWNIIMKTYSIYFLVTFFLLGLSFLIHLFITDALVMRYQFSFLGFFLIQSLLLEFINNTLFKHQAIQEIIFSFIFRISTSFFFLVLFHVFFSIIDKKYIIFFVIYYLIYFFAKKIKKKLL